MKMVTRNANRKSEIDNEQKEESQMAKILGAKM